MNPSNWFHEPRPSFVPKKIFLVQLAKVMGVEDGPLKKGRQSLCVLEENSSYPKGNILLMDYGSAEVI